MLQAFQIHLIKSHYLSEEREVLSEKYGDGGGGDGDAGRVCVCVCRSYY